MTTGKTIAWTILTFVSKVMSLLFNALSKFVIAFLLRSKDLLISWLLSLSTVIFSLVQFSHFVVFDSLWPHGLQHASLFRAQEKKTCPWFHFPPSLCCEVMELDAMILFFQLSFNLAFFIFLFHPHQRLFSSSSISAIWVLPSAFLRLLIFLLAILIPA